MNALIYRRGGYVFGNSCENSGKKRNNWDRGNRRCEKKGDYVILHAGFAIQKLNEKEAEEMLALLKEVFE